MARVNASVGVGAVVGEDGSLRDVRVVRAAGFGLDEKAVEVAKSWRFVPATSGGRRVSMPVSLVIPFYLPDPDVPTASLLFDLPSGASRPLLESGTTLSLDLPRQALHITFEVGPAGNVTAVTDAPASVNAKICEWRFKPAVLDGVPISAHARLSLYRTY